jgi:hypothetical protein
MYFCIEWLCVYNPQNRGWEGLVGRRRKLAGRHKQIVCRCRSGTMRQREQQSIHSGAKLVSTGRDARVRTGKRARFSPEKQILKLGIGVGKVSFWIVRNESRNTCWSA